jgi:hypothetical protein
MAHCERRRSYSVEGRRAALAFRMAMARAPFDRPWQVWAEGRGRRARGSRPHRRTGMAQRIDVGRTRRGPAGARGHAANRGMVETGRTDVGCTRRGPEGASRHAASRGMVETGSDMGRTRRGQAGARRYAANRRTVATGTCSRRQSNSRSARARPAKYPASELGYEALLPYFLSYCTSSSLSLGLGKSEQPPGPASGGGVEMPVSPRASSATRPFSSVSSRLVSSSLVSSRFVSSSSAPPGLPSFDRGGQQGGASPASPQMLPRGQLRRGFEAPDPML